MNRDNATNPFTARGLAIGNVLKRTRGGTYRVVEDTVSIEEPLEIQINRKPLAVTMRTPGNDLELAAGFLYTEGMIASPEGLKPDDLTQPPPNRIRLAIGKQGGNPLPELRRYGTIHASCGICGTTSIKDALKRLPPLAPESGKFIEEEVLLHLPESMREAQRQFSRSGGLHASALFSHKGKLLCIREDVGRHNALDKIAGWAFLNRKVPLSSAVLLLSGRSSFELVQKALALRIPVVAGISAPSSLAVNFARDAGITLVGFLRDNRFNIYTHPQRLHR